MKSKRFPRVGDYVTVVTAHSNLMAGSLLKCTMQITGNGQHPQGELVYAPEDSPYPVGQILTFRKAMCEPTTRERLADFFDKKITELRQRAEEALEEADELVRQAKILREFDSDAAFVADAISGIWDQNIPREKKLKMLASVVESLA